MIDVDLVAPILRTRAATPALAEQGAVAWFVVRFDQGAFAIFDAFGDESGHEAVSQRS